MISFFYLIFNSLTFVSKPYIKKVITGSSLQFSLSLIEERKCQMREYQRLKRQDPEIRKEYNLREKIRLRENKTGKVIKVKSFIGIGKLPIKLFLLITSIIKIIGAFRTRNH